LAGADAVEGVLARRARTLADVVRRVSVLPPPGRGEPWSREQIEFKVREVVRDSAGVGDFGLDAHFVRDLKID
jgi:hypothetical protein